MPTIGQPGRVASDKNTAQEILDAITSDSTQFNGADIDAAVSSRATPADTGRGIDWSSKTPRHDRVGTGSGGTMLSVSGSGYITGFVTITETLNGETELVIDGSPLLRHKGRVTIASAPNGTAAHDIRFSTNEGSDEGIIARTSLQHRFDSSFTVNNPGLSDAQIEVSYVLD